jgi:hypothetical protein
MKLSEIARYWAARELTKIERPSPNQLALYAPFPCPQFTVKIRLDEPARSALVNRIDLRAEGKATRLADVAGRRQLKSGTVHRDGRAVVVCVDLPKGSSQLVLF